MSLKSSLKKIGLKCLILILTLFYTIFIIPVFLFIFVPIYSLRFVLSRWTPWFRPDLGKILTTRSSISGIDDIFSFPKCTLLVCITVEGEVCSKNLKEQLLQQVILASKSSSDSEDSNQNTSSSTTSKPHSQCDKSQLLYPELQQYYYKFCGFLFWRWDEYFSIENHVRVYEKSRICSINERELACLRLELVKAPYEREKSPWEVIIVNNFEPDDIGGNPFSKKSVLIARVHHGLSDGYSLLSIFLNQVSKSHLNHKEKEKELISTKARYIDRNKLQIVCHYISALLLTPYEIIRHKFEYDGLNPFHLPYKKLTRNTNPASASFQMSQVHLIRKLNGGISFTSCILAALAGGIREFGLKNQIKLPQFIHVALPLPWPEHPSRKLRNYWTHSIVKLPLGIEDAQERLLFCHKNWEKIKKSTEPTRNFYLVPLVGGLTTGVMRYFVSNNITTIIMSNFPGPPEGFESDIFGYPVLDASFGGGLGRGNLGFGMALLSNNGKLKMNIGVNSGILNTQSKVQELMNNITQELHNFAKYNQDLV